MSFLSDIGNSIITAATGTDISQLQAEAAQAEQAVVIAVSTMIGLQVIMVAELLILVAMGWKERH